MPQGRTVKWAEGRRSGFLGKKHSEESRKKMRENNCRYWKGKTLSQEIRDKMKKNRTPHASFLGKHHSEETKKILSEKSKLNNPRYWLGKKMPKEMVDRMTKSHAQFYLDYRDENHPNWKGDKATYRAIHNWVEVRLGKPMNCSKCNDNTKSRYHWANINHKYERNINDWIRLCAKCHSAFDKQQKGNNY